MARKTVFECIECGRIFKRTLTDRTGEVECPNCHGVDIEVIGMEKPEFYPFLVHK